MSRRGGFSLNLWLLIYFLFREVIHVHYRNSNDAEKYKKKEKSL